MPVPDYAEEAYFLENNGNDLSRVVPIVLEGDPVGSVETTCLPEILRRQEFVERNLPSMIPDEGTKESEGWENGLIQTLCYLLHVKRENVKASIDAERVRQMKIYAAIGVVCTCIFAILALWAVRAERRAEANRKIAVENEIEAKAQRDKAEVNWHIAEANREKAEFNEKRAVAGERDAKEKKVLAETTLSFVKRMLQEGQPDEHGPKVVVDLLAEQVSKIDLLEPDDLRYSVAALVGQIMLEQGMKGPAEKLLKGATSYYREHGDDTKFTDCANSLAVLYSMNGSELEALALHEEIGRTSSATNFNAQSLATHYHNISTSYFNLGNKDAAMKYCQKARETLKGEHCSSMVRILCTEALCLEASGDLRGAYEKISEGVDIHNEIASCEDLYLLEVKGQICFRMGKIEEAKRSVSRKIEIVTRKFGDQNPELISAHNTMGLICDSELDYRGAVTQYERAIAIANKNGETSSGRLSTIYNNLATVFFKLDNQKRARYYLRKSFEITEEKYGADSDELYYPLINLAQVEMKEKNYSESLNLYNRLSSIIISKYGKDNSKLIEIYNGISTLEVKRKKLLMSQSRG